MINELIRKSKYVVAFTGAGISVESGIPDFRSPGGLWSRYDPEIYATWHNFIKDPTKYWTMSRELSNIIFTADPNPAHEALAKLEHMGKLKTIITQNIDGLHHRAGSSNVIELHGTYRTVSCLDCDKVFSRKDILVELNAGKIPPRCSDCDGVLRSNAVLFGEQLPQLALDQATEETLKSDLFIVIGSSLSVFPAASFPLLAWRNGNHLIIINKEPTNQDIHADVVINGLAGEILKAVVESLI